MRLDTAEASARFVRSEVVRLATAGADGRPHVVPCTFAMDAAERIVTGIDTTKPKSSLDLRRLRNIAENPRVSLLADHYCEDWEQLWWVRADGVASVERSGPEHAAHWERLRARYRQYADQGLAGPVIVVRVQAWAGWSFA